MLYKKILTEHKQVQAKIEHIQHQLSQMPDGKLICTHGKGPTKWYISDGHKSTYLPKKNVLLAEALAAKKYHILQLKQLLKEKAALELYLRHSPGETNIADDLLSDDSGFRELLIPYFQPLKQKQREWANAPFDTNPKHPENLIHKTGTGVTVRSKSEALIALFLQTNQIAFRYECALDLGPITLYPDFTLLHPETSEIIYWEHFGLMDDPVYYKNTFDKLQIYASHGIIPTLQLITTYETKEHPLTYDDISKIAAYYFV